MQRASPGLRGGVGRDRCPRSPPGRAPVRRHGWRKGPAHRAGYVEGRGGRCDRGREAVPSSEPTARAQTPHNIERCTILHKDFRTLVPLPPGEPGIGSRMPMSGPGAVRHIEIG